MAYNAQILLGKITKLHGYQGEVTVKLEKEFTGNLPEMETVFLEIEGKPVPFFISEPDYQGADILRLKFRDYESIEKVKEFIGARIFLTTGRKGKSISSDPARLCGFKVILPEKYILGTIKAVIEYPGQWILKIETQSAREILIPFHEHFIIKVDSKKKIIQMDLPEGLTEIN